MKLEKKTRTGIGRLNTFYIFLKSIRDVRKVKAKIEKVKKADAYSYPLQNNDIELKLHVCTWYTFIIIA